MTPGSDNAGQQDHISNSAARWWQLCRRWREHREAFDAEQDALLLESIQKAAADRGLGPEHVEKALALHVELTREHKRGRP